MGSPALIIRASREADREAIVALHMAALLSLEFSHASRVVRIYCISKRIAVTSDCIVDCLDLTIA